MSSPEIKLTPEQKEETYKNIEAAKKTLSELHRFERIGQDVSAIRAQLEKSIKDNEALLKEFG